MKSKQQTGALDFFRIIAAVLVIANHTSPLASFSADADFFLARILARLAVPFFLMVTGQFILSGAIFGRKRDCKKVFSFCRKTALLCGVAILLYLPIGVYAGLYRGLSAWDALKMLIFDGTFYHLWYFPACILGILLLAALSRILKPKGLLCLCTLLYLIGLFGDSYYGLVCHVPILSSVYTGMFQLFSYTRNGLFLAPLFLLLGAFFGKLKQRPNLVFFAAGSGVCLALMTLEGFVLRAFSLQRHDSMYLFLPVLMAFLYGLLLSFRVRPRPALRKVSTVVYLIHPAVIVLVRGVSKGLKFPVLVQNNLLMFFTVALLSVSGSFFLAFLFEKFRPRSFSEDRAWIEVDLKALAFNVRSLQSLLPENCELMPAVKADAYGHGAVAVAKELGRLGIRHFCVACIEEGIELRKHGVRGEILILGYTHPDRFPQLSFYRLTQTVLDYDYAVLLSRSGRKIRVHVGVDSGMCRLGERADHPEKILLVFGMKNLLVQGIFSHLCDDDVLSEPNRRFTLCQAESFSKIVEEINKKGYWPKVHLLSSYGLLNYPQFAGDYIRVGISLFGLLSTGEDTKNCPVPLKPVLSLKARVAAVKEILPGESVGYGRAFVADRCRKIAVIAIGYADGFPRNLSCGAGYMLIHGRKAPVIGRVCMDQTMVDITGIPDVFAGDEAVVIGRSEDSFLSAAEMADMAGTITNEIVSRLGARLPRVF